VVAIYPAALTGYLTACDASSPSMDAQSRARAWTGADLAEHEPALRYTAANLCRRRWDTDDLVQDTFERALKFLAAGHPAPTHMKAWLLSILRNAFIDRVRKKVIPHEPVDDQPAPEIEAEPAWAALSVDDIRAGLARLDDDVRRVFELHYLDGLRYREIAKRLGMPENTVASKLFRARKLLRNELDGGDER
jgi:RNA polymerase sigma-70 factor (ECF subfamily)